jgi:hypothetical protein
MNGRGADFLTKTKSKSFQSLSLKISDIEVDIIDLHKILNSNTSNNPSFIKF